MGTHEFGKFRPLRVHMIVRPKLFPNGVGRTWSLIKTWIKLDQADFTDWISFLRSNSMGRKPALIMRLSMLTPKAFHQHEKTEKTMIWWWMFDDVNVWWWIIFVVWLTGKRHSALFSAGTTFRNPHHHESLTPWAGFEPT